MPPWSLKNRGETGELVAPAIQGVQRDYNEEETAEQADVFKGNRPGVEWRGWTSVALYGDGCSERLAYRLNRGEDEEKNGNEDNELWGRGDTERR